MDFIQYKAKCPNDVPLRQYVLQLQHQMHCTGIAKGVLAILVGGNDLKLFDYEYRPAIGVGMEKLADDFFKSIAENEQPNVENAQDLAIVSLLHTNDNRHVDFDKSNEFNALCADLLEATEARKKAEAIEKISKARIIQMMDGYNTASNDTYSARLTQSKDTAGTTITAEMVGQVIGARKGSLKLTIKEKSE